VPQRRRIYGILRDPTPDEIAVAQPEAAAAAEAAAEAAAAAAAAAAASGPPVYGPDYPPDVSVLPAHTLQTVIQETMKAMNSSGMIIQQLIQDRIIPRDRAADALDTVARGMWVPLKMLMGGNHVPHTMDFGFAAEKQYDFSIYTDINKLQHRDTVELAADKVVWRFNITHLLVTLGISIGAAAGIAVTQYAFQWKTLPFWS
jgi:hypothetical protein